MRFCIVDQATGHSRHFVDCPESLIAANTPSGCIAVQADGVEVGDFKLLSGVLVPIDRTARAPTEVEAWTFVRSQRDDLLRATDWRVARAMESGVLVPGEWRAYRQALRDITKQADPLQIVWPEEPAEGK